MRQHVATNETFLILHNIRSAQNVGAIFRTADAVGVSKIFLTGYTPLPTDRFGRKRKDVAKAALGAEEYVPWRHHTRIDSVLKNFHAEDVQIVGVEQAPEARDFRTFKPNGRTAYIFGNEVHGLSPTILKRCDTVIHIPMIGKKESLNVSVAVGVILFCV